MTAAVRILLIDDQISSLLALEEILSGLDAVLVKASSAKEALLTMLEQDIHCILLDVSMPGMDGFEFLKTLRQAPAHARIPVIMVTGKVFSENETLRAYQNGAVDFLLKPLDSDVVYRKVGFFADQARRMMSMTAIEAHMERLAGSAVEPLRGVRRRLEADPDTATAVGDALAALEDLQQAWEGIRNDR